MEQTKERLKHSFYAKYGKRIFDFCAALAMILVLWPVLLILGLAVAAKDGFPVIYKQERMGKDYKPFMIYKFRTMVKNADKIGPTSTAQGDPRITKIGKILRATSLDELPQLVNILKGDMSLVGCRPDVRRDTHNPEDKKYLLKPGVTGYAQVYGRSGLTQEEKRMWENRYPEDVGFATDIKILIDTVKVVLKRDSAY